MSDFYPGEGWRAANEGEWTRGTDTLRVDTADGRIRYWVRETPVPPLPTAPYTVIRTGPMRWVKCGLWHDGNMVGNPDAWLLLGGESPTENRAIAASNLQGQVIYGKKHLIDQIEEFGIEVLSEPRAVTAKALLYEFEVCNWDTSRETVAQIASTFGVSDE